MSADKAAEHHRFAAEANAPSGVLFIHHDGQTKEQHANEQIRQKYVTRGNHSLISPSIQNIDNSEALACIARGQNAFKPGRPTQPLDFHSLLKGSVLTGDFVPRTPLF